MGLNRPAFPLAARAASFVVKLLGLIAKSFIALVIFFVCLILASFLIYILMKAIGLDDYTVWVMYVVFCVWMGVMISRRVRKSQGIDGPGTEVHNSRLRSTVKEELNRSRRKKPYPHA
jgi:hypothetical protein